MQHRGFYSIFSCTGHSFLFWCFELLLRVTLSHLTVLGIPNKMNEIPKYFILCIITSITLISFIVFWVGHIITLLSVWWVTALVKCLQVSGSGNLDYGFHVRLGTKGWELGGSRWCTKESKQHNLHTDLVTGAGGALLKSPWHCPFPCRPKPTASSK